MNNEFYDNFITNKFIAHRGLHNAEIPENSLLAFKNAIDNGYNIELDVHLLGDGTVVVMHDTTLSRMTGKDGYLNNLTKDDLKDHKLLNTNETIPTLKEVLDLVDGQTGIIIELKNTTKRVGLLEKAVCKLLREYKGGVAIMSFNPLCLEWFYKYAPNILRGLCSSYFDYADAKQTCWLTRWFLKRLKFTKKCKPNFIAYAHTKLPNKYVNKYVGKLPILAWTLKNQEDYRIVAPHVDNIIFEGFTPKKVNKN